MKLDDVVVGNIAMAKLYKENSERINSLDFNRDGTLLISSSDDDSIIIFDCNNGTKKRSVNSKKYGVDLIRFTHADNTAVHCSRKVDDTIRYLSLHDNKYIRYFPGHTKQVVTLCMSPLDDTFLSGSVDKTLRLWDLRSNNCQGLMTVPGHPVAAFDPEGVIFAAGINSQHVKLYDLRSFDKGPFVTFKLDQEKECDWTELTFSPDGKTILIQTNGAVLRVIDAYQGALMHTLTGHQNAQCKPLSGSFSPDSKYVFCGSSDHSVYAWNVEGGRLVHHFSGEHGATVQHAKFNPKYMMLASACSILSFWIPQISDED